MAKKKEIPFGIKVISDLYLLGSFFAFLLGILLFFLIFFDSNLDQSSLLIDLEVIALHYINSLLSIVFFLMHFLFILARFFPSIIFYYPFLRGILLLLAGGFSFFVARDLKGGRAWARITVLCFAFFGIVLALFFTFFIEPLSILVLVFNTWIVAYLLTHQKAKTFFV